MIFLIRFTINFCISFIILSIPVNDKTIFNHIYQLTKPVASKKIKGFKKKSKSFFFGKDKLRKNINQEKKLSEFSTGHKLQTLSLPEKNPVEGAYTDEEQEVMRMILKNHN